MNDDREQSSSTELPNIPGSTEHGGKPDTGLDGAPSTTIIEGHLAVSAALRSGNREIMKVYVRDGRIERTGQDILTLAQERGIETIRMPHEKIEAIVSGRSHGGIAAEIGARKFLTCDQLTAKDGHSAIIMLDGIEDPHNFGSCVRSLFTAGIDGIVLRTRNWMSAANVVTRASAGASEYIPAALADSAADAAAHFRAHGYRIACADASPHAANVYDCDFNGKVFVLIGGEKRGITRSFLDEADMTIKIPYGRQTGIALDAASATAVLAFEILRQRQGERPPSAGHAKRTDAQQRGRDLLNSSRNRKR